MDLQLHPPNNNHLTDANGNQLGSAAAVAVGTFLDSGANTTYHLARVDTTPPTLTVSHGSSGANGYNLGSPVTLLIETHDFGGTGVAPGSLACSDNGNPLPVFPFSGQFGAQVFGDGTHAVSCSSRDNAGNARTTLDTVKIDTVKPTVAISNGIHGQAFALLVKEQ